MWVTVASPSCTTYLWGALIVFCFNNDVKITSVSSVAGSVKMFNVFIYSLNVFLNKPYWFYSPHSSIAQSMIHNGMRYKGVTQR